MSSVSVRPVALHDLPAISQIAAHFVDHTAVNLSVKPLKLQDWQQIYRKVQEANHPFFVAIDQEEGLLGYCYAHFYRPKEGYRFTLEVTIYLKPNCEGRGIGKKLMSEMIEFSKKSQHIKQLLAIITELDQDTVSPSIAFHRAMGFRDSGRIVKAGYKFDQFYDIIILQLSVE